MTSWKEYYSVTVGKAHRPLVEKAVSYANGRDACLDIGAGALNDIPFLLDQGFREIVAIDSSDDFPLPVAETFPKENFTAIRIRAEQYDLSSNHFDLITAQFSLPFMSTKHDLRTLWRNINIALKDGGIFCGQLFGERDSWHTGKNLILFHSKEEVDDLVNFYEVLLLEEENKDGTTASGEKKHWHIFSFILKKK